MQPVILFAVVELFLDPGTDLNPMSRRRRHVATIKEGMQVLAQKDAVRGRVCSARRVRSDVDCFEHMEYRRIRKSTPSFV
jgi:hypothetical protein